jgi:2-methylisocitrate lyase-like PEP mutase family enzyme
MDQTERAVLFRKLHVAGDPLIIFNVWDAGTAKVAAEAGSKAIATGSYAVALGNGFDDGENVPIELVTDNLKRIVGAVDVPVSLDFEGGYAAGGEALSLNVKRVIAAGAVGINFEDRVVKGSGLYSVEQQSERIRTIRAAADETDVPFFVNARCDVVLPLDTATHTNEHIGQMILRAKAYSDAGADGFFAPGLIDPALIEKLVNASPIPVNILVRPGVPSSRTLADLGVARISYGGSSYRTAMDAFMQANRKALEWNHTEQTS